MDHNGRPYSLLLRLLVYDSREFSKEFSNFPFAELSSWLVLSTKSARVILSVCKVPADGTVLDGRTDLNSRYYWREYAVPVSP